MKELVKADPTKEFFVYMLTKDIALEDCILDLIDNCADGARRVLASKAGDGVLQYNVNYSGSSVGVHFDSNKFVIEDNCGGISIDLAKDYAFRFGRRSDSPDDVSYGIGLFGIGMKRAMFKLGRKICIESSTDSEAFFLEIDVDNWMQDSLNDRWDFELERVEEWQSPGTKITVENLYPGISAEFGDSNFEIELIRLVGKAYSIFIQNGFSVQVNSKEVTPFVPEFLSSEDFQPANISYRDDGVEVKIIAGPAESPPDDSSAEAVQERSIRSSSEKWGWYIVCNDRVVMAGDRTSRTVWGDDHFPRWHPQYNGFIGLAQFYSEDPGKLPWTTTKRDIDEERPVYQRAVSKMKNVTRTYIDYTSRRKANLEEAKRLERIAQRKRVEKLTSQPLIKLPPITSKPKIKMANILYQKPQSLVHKVAKALGKSKMTYKEIGEKTFDYFVENEGID